MRTTVTLEPDVAALVRKMMRERGLTFKQAVNEGLRAALRPRSEKTAFRTPSFRMQLREDVDLTKSAQLTSALEDETLLEKLRSGR